ncbi:MAG: DUF2670 domain-containing protein [Alphaproteobacteria bacterium]
MSDKFGQFETLRKLLTSAKTVFIYGILTKWYLLIAIPAFWATYYFLHEFEKTGIPSRIRYFIGRHLEMLVGIAKKCTPHIGDLSNFYNCLNSM